MPRARHRLLGIRQASSVMPMATASPHSGRNLVLIGYGAVTVSLGRVVVDLFSQIDWSSRLLAGQRIEHRLRFGEDVMFTFLMIALLLGVWFVLWVDKTSTKSTEHDSLAKVVSLVLAGQSALFAIGVLVNIVSTATLNFPHFSHPGFASFGWEYPVPGGLLLAAVGYFKVWRALGARSIDTSNNVPADSQVEGNPVNRALEN